MKILTVKNTLAVLIVFLLSACSANLENKTNDSEQVLAGNTIYWVNSYQSTCTGLAIMPCLLVSKDSDINNAKWLSFYDHIEGFTFEAGSFQKIEIHEEKLDLKIVPADASSIRYTLIKVIERKMDPRFILNDSWQVETILGLAVENKGHSPWLEINLSTMKATGTDGCNNYIMQIIALTDTHITFSPAALTRKMCRDMKIPESYIKALNQSVKYQQHKTTLKLFDEAGNETLSFNKMN